MPIVVLMIDLGMRGMRWMWSCCTCEEGQFDLEPPPAKITRFQDAISSLEAVQIFLDSRGYPEEATSIATATIRLTYCHCESLDSARQSTLTEYF